MADRPAHSVESARPDWRAIAERLASVLADCTVPGPKVGEERWAALEAYRAAQYDGLER